MEASINIEPWPIYSDDGYHITWLVHVVARKRQLTLKWSGRLGRFAKSWDLMQLRRSAPKTYQEVVSLMADFCPKKQQSEGLSHG